MASIRRRGNGYQVQVRRVGSKPLTRTFTIKADAERWARRAEIQVENGDSGSLMPGSTTLRSLLERYATHHACHLKSRKQTLSLVNLMIERLGHLPVSSINNPCLAEYRDARLSIVSSQTVRKEIDIVRRVIKLAREEWGLNSPLGIPTVRMPRQPSGRERRVSSFELEELNAHLSPVMRLAVQIALDTAMRRGEIARIDAADLIQPDYGLVVPETKNGRRRVVPLTRSVYERLCEQLQRSNGKFGIRPDSITQAFQRACAKTSIENLRFHDLRHEAITRMFESGLSVPRVSRISGHADYRMLARYTHLD